MTHRGPFHPLLLFCLGLGDGGQTGGLVLWEMQPLLCPLCAWDCPDQPRMGLVPTFSEGKGKVHCRDMKCSGARSVCLKQTH